MLTTLNSYLMKMFAWLEFCILQKYNLNNSRIFFQAVLSQITSRP